MGVKPTARINNFGVAAELVGSLLLVILLIFHLHRGPGVVFRALGTGAGDAWGYLGDLLIGGIISAWVFGGFDTAGTRAEGTRQPRRNAPPAIIGRLTAAGVIGGLLILFALMSVNIINDKNIGLLGLPCIVKQALGNTAGDVFLVDAAIAITVCTLLISTGCIRLLFSMGRDGRLPFGLQLAHVSGRAGVPIAPAMFVGASTLVLLAFNIANQSAFATLTSLTVIMVELGYLAVAGSMLDRRLRREWPRPEHGNHFSLGRWGPPINLLAVTYGALVCFEVAWRGRSFTAKRGTTGSAHTSSSARSSPLVVCATSWFRGISATRSSPSIERTLPQRRSELAWI
jgi:amino acid transporter